MGIITNKKGEGGVKSALVTLYQTIYQIKKAEQVNLKFTSPALTFLKYF